MLNYIIKRLLLLPVTLFFIIVVNFTIINFAPGEPASVTEISERGEAERLEGGVAASLDDRYLQFRERYGLTLPVLFNLWPMISPEYVDSTLLRLELREEPFKRLHDLRIRFGDQARFIMPRLLDVMNDPMEDMAIRQSAIRFFVRGGLRQAVLGGDLTPEQQRENKEIAAHNEFLTSQLPTAFDTEEEILKKIERLDLWYEENGVRLGYEPDFWEKVSIFFFETRFSRYFSRVLTLDFGTLRDDPRKTVVAEVSRRFKYSLTLSVTPMLITFFLCLFFGLTMALKQNRFPDYSLNFIFLILYAIPIFVVAPFLIEEVALKYGLPISGFTSPENIYNSLTTPERFADVVRHIFLPIVAIMYGTLAAQTRLARTAVLEVSRQDYVRTARAKGLANAAIIRKYIGRNASITIVTSLAGSLGVILGGSLIVETLFEIDGFGKFFYDAVLNRDYNVIMFSAIAGSFLSLLGYLAADIAYTILDPRVTFE